MTDNDVKTICEKIDSLHAKILNSKFAEIVTESEILSLILAVQELNRQKAEIERLRSQVNRLKKYDEERDIRLHARLTETAKAEAIEDVLLTLEAEAVSSDKYIREYDDSEVQKAYNQALWKAYNLVKEMVGE